MFSVQKTYSISEIEPAVKWFFHQLKNEKVIAFHGNMGAGKTTFISAACQFLGVTDGVNSPTFSIINEYAFSLNGEPELIYHIDLYRLKTEQEAVEAGVEDCMYSGNYCFVEWAERAPNLFPAGTVNAYLYYENHNTRILEIEQRA